MNFLITGLPRSRTAWLANLLTWGRTFCHHEVLYKARPADLNLLADKTRAEGFLTVGGSDSGLAFVWRDVVEYFPNANWLIVRRPVQEVVKSYSDYFTAFPIQGQQPLEISTLEDTCLKMDMELDALSKSLPDSRKLVVRFADLEGTNTVRYLWHFLSAERFSMLRYTQQKDFRINLKSENYDLRKVCHSSGDETKA